MPEMRELTRGTYRQGNRSQEAITAKSCVLRTSPLEPRTSSSRSRALMNEVRRREIFDRDAERFIDSDVIDRYTTGNFPEEDFADFTQQMIVANCAFVSRDNEIAGLVQTRLTRIREEPCTPSRFRVELSVVREARADRVHVRAGR